MNVTTYTGDSLTLAAARPGPTPDYVPAQISAHRAEGHVANDQARCSWWLDSAPPLAGERPGILGHFAATSPDAARAVLDQTCTELACRGATVAIGPMDGNTWRRYRWVTDSSPDEAPFLMEPANPPAYPAWWTSSGFAPLATYQSALVTALDTRDPRLVRVRERLARDGITLRTLASTDDPARFETELRALHAVSLVSFAHNLLYTPLSADDFVAQYLPYRGKICPDFVFIAEHAGRCVGYMFSLPDYLRAAAKPGKPHDTLILKTAAILPGRAYAGLGALLAEMTHHAARAAGFTRVIHALALDDNPVTNITARHGSVMRRYTLFTRRLAASPA